MTAFNDAAPTTPTSSVNDLPLKLAQHPSGLPLGPTAHSLSSFSRAGKAPQRSMSMESELNYPIDSGKTASTSGLHPSSITDSRNFVQSHPTKVFILRLLIPYRTNLGLLLKRAFLRLHGPIRLHHACHLLLVLR